MQHINKSMQNTFSPANRIKGVDARRSVEKFKLAEKVKHFQWRTLTHQLNQAKTKENEFQF